MNKEMEASNTTNSKTDNLWQGYCAIKSHLNLLSEVVISGNQSAAIQFALQTNGILQNLEVCENQ